jgi:flagellar protein FlaG
MDIKAARPVSNVPATAAAGKRADPNPAKDKAPVRPVVEPPPVRDLQHTLAVVAEQLNEYLRSSSRDLEFHVDSGADTTVVTVRNPSTGEVVRQIPNEDALRLMRNMNAQSGTFVDLTA